MTGYELRVASGSSLKPICESMKLLIIVYLKTKSMKNIDWKSVALYIIRIIEMLLTGAAGGALVTTL